MKVFLDTWAWLALRDRREARHSQVSELYRKLRANRDALFTTDYVLVETYTFLFGRLPIVLAIESLNYIEDTIETGFVKLVWITPERFSRIKALRFKYQDKPGISFTDLSSMAVMSELNISTVITGDAHFAQVGMGFQVAP